jgi:lipoate-protein ligase A
MRWHFFRTAPARGTFNMALDEALMRSSQRTGNAYFRVYGWETPTLSLGRNQRARGHYDLEAAKQLGIAIVRRPTGGRALLHDREITYSVAMPALDPAAAAAAYAFINEVLLDGLQRLGVSATRATGAAHAPPGLRPCFDAPSAHEIVVGERKLVGSAQWRRGDTLLQHGSILVRDDQAMIQRLVREPLAETPAAASLGDALGRDPSLEEASAPLCAALEARTGATPGAFDPGVLASDVTELERSYAADTWTWRR